MHLLDIIQNSISAQAKRINVDIKADVEADFLFIDVEDDGTGMDEELIQKVTDPFVTSRSTRKVGLGIPLLKYTAQRCEGELQIYSQKGKGTLVKSSFKLSHIDRPPIGDIADTIVTIIAANPQVDIVLNLKNNSNEITLDTAEVKQKLGEVPITEFNVLSWIKDFINEGVINIFGGVLNEVTS